jgi:hypothetical protein
MRAVGFALAINALSPVVAAACAFDMVKPERTAIDWIVEAEQLVLARSNVDDPFRYGVTETLLGSASGAPISHLVDTATRGKLAADPSGAVLFAQIEGTGWQRVAFVDDSFRPVLEAALAERANWRTGMTAGRMAYIAALQESDDPVHKRLVIGELDKIEYAALQDFDLRIPAQELLADLWAQNEYPYQAIRALLLGLSDDPVAHAEIDEVVGWAIGWGGAQNLGAFAAAHIETEGAAGVERLARGFFDDPLLQPDPLEQVLMAFSVHHGLDDPQVTAAIHREIAALVAARPEASVIVARQFTLRSDWQLAALLEPLVRERRIAALPDLLTVSVYVARGREDDASKGR